MAAYGYRVLGLWFSKLLDVDPDGFVYRGTRYTWRDVIKIEHVDSKTGSLPWRLFDGRLPRIRTYLHLRDGARILVNGITLEKEGVCDAWWPGDGGTDAYKELIAFASMRVEKALWDDMYPSERKTGGQPTA
jgi:hypothetical protein